MVAGPITALNLGERVPERTFRRPGRALLVVASLALVALGWLGWTVGFRNRERGAGWAVHTDATLARAATSIAAWREKNGIPSDRHVFTTHVDLGHYLAWFAPGEKSSLDSRFQLFGYSDYVSLSRVLGLLPANDQASETLEQILGQKQIAAVALYDPDPRRFGAALSTVLYKDQPSVKIARVDGSCVLLVPAETPGATTFDPERMAFGQPSEDDVSAASNGPAALAEPILRRGSSSPCMVGAVRGKRTPPRYTSGYSRRSHHDDDRFPFVPSFPLWFAGETLRAARSPARSPALPLLAVRAPGAARRSTRATPARGRCWDVPISSSANSPGKRTPARG